MWLAIGDIVQERGGNNALGAVVGVAAHGTGRFVLVDIPGAGLRPMPPHELTVAARRPAPASTTRGLLALFTLLVGVIGTYLSCQAAQQAGAGWLLTLLSGYGAFTAVATAHRGVQRITGPRRFRV
ncbi:hypothetical protein [Streptomyces sp. NPDC004134]|uniref:hypothetical protein n=1 Tax=Streptomyces sp. NPDC004134 TaxID=3364691 RepID=UPI0036B880E1